MAVWNPAWNANLGLIDQNYGQQITAPVNQEQIQYLNTQPQYQQPQAPASGQSLDQIASSLNGFGNTDAGFLSSLPTFNVGDEDAIGRYTGVANAGTSFQGLGAFLRSGPQYTSGPGGDVGGIGSYDSRTTGTADALAKALGLGPIDWNQEALFQSNPYPTVGNNGTSKFQQMSDMLKDYRLIGGLTQDPNDPERLMNEALYKNINGVWTPISGRQTTAQENHGWAKSGAGSDFLSAMSLIAPAIGGVIGAAGAGAGGTAAATQGIGGTIANTVGLGEQFAGLPQFAQGAINGALQGAGNSLLSGGNPLSGALMGGLSGGMGNTLNDTIKGLGLGGAGSGALQGAATGALGSAINGGNPLTGGLMGGLSGGVSGGLQDFGASGQVGQMGGKFASQLAGNYLQNQIKNEIFQGRQDLMQGLYQEAQNRGVSTQQLEAFLQTPQGRKAVQQLIAQQGKGTLQSLFG